LLGDRLHGSGPCVDGQRRPDLNLFTATGKLNPCWGHANDEVRLAIEIDGPADDSNISFERCFPERMTDNDRPRAGIFVVRLKAAPERQLNLEKRKEFP